ncbi:type II toxin-antitoxin system RatA family toxin [Nordella sp. HKS 07]|uniref:type II toxin-antitoxin system RatA family toxin n=1 Tax=Nordella sp. HKS 07 TaxID=2712222 RepID=UPI0013E14115|nr:type II toxin-antitoxin system RatA family toxin [Nordella sp. HKS 07]QIG51170.1 type II toxin-antitoxin system RatA family toxin [Nordella sp. HKS 07]
MPKFNVTREMPYKAAELFAVAADVDSYKDFLPLVESSRSFDRVKVADGVERFKGELRVRYKKLHIDETFLSDVVADRAALKVSSRSEGGLFDHVIAEWRFSDRKTGGATVEFQVDYKAKSRSLQFFMSGMFDYMVRKINNAFEARARELHGKA